MQNPTRLELNVMSVMSEFDKLMLPDENRWGQGYGDKPYTLKELNEIADNVAPAWENPIGNPRWVTAWRINQHVYNGRLCPPEGHDDFDHPNRRGASNKVIDPDIPTAWQEQPWQIQQSLQEIFIAKGWPLDLHGRPYNPRADQLITNPRIGLKTGIGYGYYFGDNAVVDVIVKANGKTLVISKPEGKINRPALVDSYVIPADYGISSQDWKLGNRPLNHDGLIAAAHRILQAETRLCLPSNTQFRLIRAIRPISTPHTLNFWTTTFTLLAEISPKDVGKIGGKLRPKFVTDSRLAGLMHQMRPDHRRGLLAAI